MCRAGRAPRRARRAALPENPGALAPVAAPEGARKWPNSSGRQDGDPTGGQTGRQDGDPTGWASLHFEGQSDDAVLKLAFHAFEQIDFERLSDVITGEVFDALLDAKVMAAALPWRLWCERPARLMVCE